MKKQVIGGAVIAVALTMLSACGLVPMAALSWHRREF